MKIYAEAELAGIDAARLCQMAVDAKGGLNVRLDTGALIVVTAFSSGRSDGPLLGDAALQELEELVARTRAQNALEQA